MARKAVLMGGVATLAAAVVVIGAVSVANAVAITDSSGVPAGTPVVVPTGEDREADEARTPRSSQVPEVVPAPAPLDIAETEVREGALEHAPQRMPDQIPAGPPSDGSASHRGDPQTPAHAGPPSGDDSPKASSGSKKDQSRVESDRRD
ncbi:MAG TPA: hypothetical protein VFY91_09905 [Microbacterium sp.]|nr:hypothetical protein [Microbacterium sp.]